MPRLFISGRNPEKMKIGAANNDISLVSPVVSILIISMKNGSRVMVFLYITTKMGYLDWSFRIYCVWRHSRENEKISRIEVFT